MTLSRKWTRSRKAKVTRNKNGSFRSWKGGERKQSHNGAMGRVGKEFRRQHKRPAKVGDVVRNKNKDGSFNKGSPWYVRTIFGWRPVKKARGGKA